MSDCKPVATPLEAGVRYDKRGDDEESCETQKYQKAIGCLTYLSTATRPDIAAAVGMLSKFMVDPGITHWIGVKRVLLVAICEVLIIMAWSLKVEIMIR